MIYIYSS